MINVPWNENQNWDIKKSQLRKNVINKINATLSIDINSLIETEKIITPKNISNDTLSYKGALYGSSSNSKLSAFLRHPNFTKKLKNLYFVGGSVHPGGGIPLCLLSAKIVDNIISSKDLRYVFKMFQKRIAFILCYSLFSDLRLDWNSLC